MKLLITIALLSVSLITIAQTPTTLEINKEEAKMFKTKALKVEFFSPLTGNLTFAYEKYINNGMSLEGKIGIIGTGVDLQGQQGFFSKFGTKFKLSPDYITSDLKSSHPLRGGYLKPELMVTHFKYRYKSFIAFNSSNGKNTSVALLINYGKQYVLTDVLTLDWYLGAGYGYSTDEDGTYAYGATIAHSSFPIAFASGFTVGILL